MDRMYSNISNVRTGEALMREADEAAAAVAAEEEGYSLAAWLAHSILGCGDGQTAGCAGITSCICSQMYVGHVIAYHMLTCYLSSGQWSVSISAVASAHCSDRNLTGQRPSDVAIDEGPLPHPTMHIGSDAMLTQHTPRLFDRCAHTSYMLNCRRGSVVHSRRICY